MRRRGLGKAVAMFATLAVLFTAGMMSHDNERHQYVWGYLWETATSEFSENDAPFAGAIVMMKDLGWYALEAFAALTVALFLTYGAGIYGVGMMLGVVLWYVFGYPVHDPVNALLLFPLVGGALTGFLVRREEPESLRADARWWKAVKERVRAACG